MKSAFLAVLIVSAALIACKLPSSLTSSNGSTASNSTNSTDSEPGTAGTSTAGRDPKGEIASATRKFSELPYFSAQMDGTGPNEIHMKLEYVAPDKYHVSHTGGPVAGSETVIIGKDSFLKMNGKWMKFPGNLGDSIKTMRDQFTEEGLKRLNDVKFLGDDSVDGKPAYAYSYKSNTPVDNTAFTSKVWVVKATGLPAKIEVNYESGKMKTMTVNYDTDTPVSIEPPIK